MLSRAQIRKLPRIEIDCCSARMLGADRRSKALICFDSEGSNFDAELQTRRGFTAQARPLARVANGIASSRTAIDCAKGLDGTALVPVHAPIGGAPPPLLDKTIRAIRVSLEILGISSGVAHPMFG